MPADPDRLPPGQQWVAPGRWPPLGERAPRVDDSPWTLSITGAVEYPATYSLDELKRLDQVEHLWDIHCVTRWSKPDVLFRGVPLFALLDRAGLMPIARFASFVARTDRSHSTSLPIDDLRALNPLVVHEVDGAPLPGEHGGPLRLVVPRRYFYKSLKWLERIELLPEDRLGYWEAMAGYHNEADPWREQRFLAAQLSKQDMQRILERRDFSGRDLRGLAARGHDLTGLDARGAILRNADFRDARLVGACFDGVNLTLSTLQRALLEGATFRKADLEGVEFAGADLRGVDFTGASFVATSFFNGDDRARFDRATRIDESSLAQLMPEQQAYVRTALENAG